jgi:hypothetical protein
MRHLKTVGSILAALTLVAGITSAKAGIVHRYSFNTDANDLVGTAHGTLLNGAVITNNAVALNVAANGTSYVNLPNGIISSLTNVTIEAWVTPVARNAWGRVFDFWQQHRWRGRARDRAELRVSDHGCRKWRGGQHPAVCLS